MRLLLLLRLGATLIATFAWSGAQASLVQINFTGYFSQAHGTLFNANDVFSGSYTFESTAPTIAHPDPTLTLQSVAVSPSLPGTGWNLTVYSSTVTGTYSVSGNSGNVAFGNNASIGDRYVATLYTGGTLPAGNALNFFQLDLIDGYSAGADMLPVSSLSSVPIFSLTQTAGGRFFVAGNTGACQQCSIALSSLTPVPLPAAAWLFLSGFGAIGIVARRKRST